MTEYRFIEPLDVLYLRGNKLFGDAGAHGSALMPPWPSLAAGALRSRMLADHGVDFSDFANDIAVQNPALAACLGTPKEPGAFRISAFTLGQRPDAQLEMCFPLPADVVVQNKQPYLLKPQVLSPKLRSSYPLPELPVLATGELGKPESGYWLNSAGLAKYLNGGLLTKAHLIETKKLWKLDPRLGIALNTHSRTADEGKIYTAETVALCSNAGFLVGVQGANDLLPNDGFLRFGGDSRAAKVQLASIRWPEPNWKQIEKDRCFRLILATPGLFVEGWRLPGLDDNHQWHWQGGSARLISASVSRAEVVSGWDLAQWQPKTAQRVAPVGSVYWFRDFVGDINALKELTEQGLVNGLELSRRAEGFNNVLIAAWPQSNL